MSNMEFCYASYFNTTTMASITSGTTSVANLFDRKNNTFYRSSGFNDDTTATTIRLDLGTSQNINRIVLEGINWKSFKIYHSSNTANTFTLLNAPTTASDWTGNSTTNMYLEFATVAAQIITIDATTTMVANQEKICSGIWVLEKYHAFTDNPTANDYDPLYESTQYKHEMSDGGVAVYYIQDTFSCKISRKYVDPTEYDYIYGLFTLNDAFVFVPFPTGTGWDGKIWLVNWTGNFDGMQYTHNYKGNGYSVKMTFEECAK